MVTVNKNKFFGKYLPIVFGVVLIASASLAYAAFRHNPEEKGSLSQRDGAHLGQAAITPKGAPSGDGVKDEGLPR